MTMVKGYHKLGARREDILLKFCFQALEHDSRSKKLKEPFLRVSWENKKDFGTYVSTSFTWLYYPDEWPTTIRDDEMAHPEIFGFFKNRFFFWLKATHGGSVTVNKESLPAHTCGSKMWKFPPFYLHYFSSIQADLLERRGFQWQWPWKPFFMLFVEVIVFGI